MKTIVLDTNELARDWMLGGLKYQLFEHLHHTATFEVYIPAVVFEELVASHGRAVKKIEASTRQVERERRRLGLAPMGSTAESSLDYRQYVEEQFDERLSFTVLPWPSVSHFDLAMRAVTRTPPFSEKGTGYRDALIWTDVVDLASNGHDVAFVSMDRAFADEDGELASLLHAEIDPLPGSVELVRDFTSWLIDSLPWNSVTDLATAVSLSRTSEFYDWYLNSDFQDELVPTVEDLGFRTPPTSFEIIDVRWDGEFMPIEGAVTDDEGLTLVEYDLGQSVAFRAEFEHGAELESGWSVREVSHPRGFAVEGSIDMRARVAVLYGGEFGFGIEQLSWRRVDGLGPGVSASLGR
ncbi:MULTISPECIES: PIN domain-containing protein [Aeromicrobium]|uniref:DUF4935 domain-containing protein n=1 Tax=Aeromicrobium erythreum TaxID=2041 RepID=A0A0U4D7X3_9ACTN|nr:MULTISPECIES: PIN domain-containing protein [Aeromicrobium]ALX04290.1 hypothetical protein AERYTH_06050 [Aeromicrobium erythreum]